tara:strand:+ start:5695 stop:6033 length:339 start_codon:yes stop_codon:yes gene_type:complete
MYKKKSIVSFENFQMLDIRIGEVLLTEIIKKNLHKITINIGNKNITTICNLGENTNKEEIIGKKICVLLNDKPNKIKGVNIQGSILSVKNEFGKLIFLEADTQDIKAGFKVH